MKIQTIITLFSISVFTMPATANISTEQLIELGNYINSNVDQKTVKEVSRMSQCSAIAKYFNPKLSGDLLERSYGKLLANSEIDKKIAENYIVAGALFFTSMLVEKKYIDPSNPQGSQTISATKDLYSKMCSGV